MSQAKIASSAVQRRDARAVRMWTTLIRAKDDPVRLMMFGWWLRGGAARRDAFLMSPDGGTTIETLKSAVRNLPSRELANPSVAQHTSPSRFGYVLGVSAVSMLAGAIVGYLLVDSAIGTPTYTTPLGGYGRVFLADSSLVELNTDTEIRADVNRYRRVIDLRKGEALVTVQPASSTPFLVRTSQANVRADEGRFSVRALDAEHVRVLVNEGSVSLMSTSYDPDRPRTVAHTQIQAGEVATASKGHVSLRQALPDEYRRAESWRNSLLSFSGETLAEVVEELNRYNKTKLLIADPAVRNIRFGGVFRPSDLDAFMQMISVALDVHSSPPQATPSGSVIYLYRDDIQISSEKAARVE